ncbi:MAG: serine/threonine protein kinase [Isosphaeraceae bacterium]
MAKVSATPKLSTMKYRVVKPLGNGAGSTILEISDKTAGGKRYALKVVKRQDADDDVYIEQARTEYEVAQKLNHPAIARIYDLRQKRSWFRLSGVELLMEYVEGKTLDEIEAPDINQLLLMFCQVASALSHMHRRGVFHGDMKPQNIMLSKTGQVKLIDFGTCWIRGQNKDRVQGTPQYIAPETASEKIVDARSDVYNLGATMYRMFTGRFANQGIPKPGETRKIPAPTQLNKKIPAQLSELIMACLDLTPDKRPGSMFDIQHKLVEIAKSLGLSPEEDLKGSDDDED